jgi:hypothetical protein
MSAFSDDPDDIVCRILGESRAVNRQSLHSRKEGVPHSHAGFGRRIASIRASLAQASAGHAPGPLQRIDAHLRLAVALSSLPGGERRGPSRWPLSGSGRLRLGSGETPVTLLDLGAGGAMVAPIAGFREPSPVDAILILDGDIVLAVTVETDADDVGHVAFACADHPLATELDEWAAHYESRIWQAAALANAAEATLESALAQRGADAETLFGGTGDRHASPQGAAAAGLAALLARVLAENDDVAYVSATNRDGLPAIPPASRSRRAHDVSPSDAPCPGAVPLRAGRFASGPVVQTYRTMPGREPAGVFADVAAPVFVRGRRWGCVRIGTELPKREPGR